MKHLKYKLFAIIYNFFSLFPKKKDKISFIPRHNKNIDGNIKFIYEELKNRGFKDFKFIIYGDYRLGLIKKLNSYIKTFIIGAYYLANSNLIFLNDNFLPLAYMKIKKETTIVQLWHGAGAFKKFGLSKEEPEEIVDLEKKISENYDIIPVSSKNVSKFYEEAFGVNKEKVISLGVPKIDYYYKKQDLNEIKNDLYKKFPNTKNKKLILYAPTHRENQEIDSKLLEYFNPKIIKNAIGEDFHLAIKLHPKYNSYHDLKSDKYFTNLTDYEDEKELLLIADILITDYSSIMLEFALLRKPIIFYSYDYEDYITNERGFYFNYDDVPGDIVKNEKELIKAIKNCKLNRKKLNKFLNNQFDILDGKSSKRIVNHALIYQKNKSMKK